MTDIYRNHIKAEKNILLYAAFVSYFPTVLSGPIQKSRELLPQLKNPCRFDSTEAKKGTVLIVWGMAEKILVANNLLRIVDRVYQGDTPAAAMYYILATVSFSLYIYADFSSYSDMARGISKLMGIHIGRNFMNPYLSTTTSEFWTRWHTSLNSWFVENLYIPLGGSRKGRGRKYMNVMIVFLVSGLWHGAYWHFVAWGAINGLLVVIGQITAPMRKRIYELAGVDEQLESIQLIKKAAVFILISMTWIFFRNGIKEALQIIGVILNFKLMNIFDEGLLEIAGSGAVTFFTVTAVLIFCIIQHKRQNEALYFEKYNRQPLLFQSMLLAVLIVACVFVMLVSATYAAGAPVNTEFLYFQF